jgi:hypothetical protein
MIFQLIEFIDVTVLVPGGPYLSQALIPPAR